MDEPLGRHNPLVRRIRALRRDPARRRAEGVFVAEGLHLAGEALASGARIELAVYADPLTATPEGSALLNGLHERGVTCRRVAVSVLEGLQDARSAQPLLTLVAHEERTLARTLAPDDATSPLAVLAHGVQDPGNLGSLQRTADAAGATLFCVSGASADPLHPRTVRASMGSVFRLPAIAVEPDDALRRFRDAGLKRVATAPDGEISYRDGPLDGPLALLFGGEGSGLPASMLEAVDAVVRIPMRAGVESLSVGAAAAVLLFEAARLR